MSGKFGTNCNITVCTKVQNPVPNSNISGLHVSENGEIFLIIESGAVFKSNKFRKTNELKFEELKFLKHKVRKITTGFNFLTILTDDNRCLSSLDSDKTNLIESNKLKKLDVLDIESGSAHILASVVPKGKKIKLKKAISAVIMGNHEPEQNTEDATKVVNAENGEIETNGNENNNEEDENDEDKECTPITIEAISCPSSVQDDEDDQEIRFINNGVDVTNGADEVEGTENNEVPKEEETNEVVKENKNTEENMNTGENMNTEEKHHVTIDADADVENHEKPPIERQKTPMVRAINASEDDNPIPDDIIDREEQSDNDMDTSPIESLNESPASDYSLEEYVKEEDKQEANNNNNTNKIAKAPREITQKIPSNISNGKKKEEKPSNGKIKKMFSGIKSKSICGSNSSVIESRKNSETDVQMSKACVLM